MVEQRGFWYRRAYAPICLGLAALIVGPFVALYFVAPFINHDGVPSDAAVFAHNVRVVSIAQFVSIALCTGIATAAIRRFETWPERIVLTHLRHGALFYLWGADALFEHLRDFREGVLFECYDCGYEWMIYGPPALLASALTLAVVNARLQRSAV